MSNRKTMIKSKEGGVSENGGGDTIERRSVSPNRVPPTPHTESAKKISDQLREAQAKELQDRVDALNVELKPLLLKHGFGFSAEPYIENGQIKAKPILMDTTKEGM